jgi:hypothetical protein
MPQHTFYERLADETVIVPTEGASALMLLVKGQHLQNTEQALRALGMPFVRLFELFSPTEIEEAIAKETGRDLVMVAIKEKEALQ